MCTDGVYYGLSDRKLYFPILLTSEYLLIKSQFNSDRDGVDGYKPFVINSALTKKNLTGSSTNRHKTIGLDSSR